MHASPIAPAKASGHDGGGMGGTLCPALTETEHLGHDLHGAALPCAALELSAHLRLPSSPNRGGMGANQVGPRRANVRTRGQTFQRKAHR